MPGNSLPKNSNRTEFKGGKLKQRLHIFFIQSYEDTIVRNVGAIV